MGNELKPDAERAAWLADKIVALGDYAKEAAAMLRRWPSASDPVGEPVAWRHVERDGIPPCDGETVYVGINSAGFACCFNQARPDGLCLMGSPECSTAQMSELRWWRVLDRPSPTLNESAASRGEKG